VSRPTSSSRLGPSITTRDTTASHETSCASLAVIGPSEESWAGPDPGSLRRVSISTMNDTCGRCPPTCGVSPSSSHSRQISASASARRCGNDRGSMSRPRPRPMFPGCVSGSSPRSVERLGAGEASPLELPHGALQRSSGAAASPRAIRRPRRLPALDPSGEESWLTSHALRPRPRSPPPRSLATRARSQVRGTWFALAAVWSSWCRWGMASEAPSPR